MANWIAIALSADVFLRSIKVAAIVGTILVGINQGDAILNGEFTPELAWKVPLTYMVPYLVSTYACVASILKR